MAHEDTLVDGSVSEMEKWGEGGEQERGKNEREEMTVVSFVLLRWYLVTSAERKDIHNTKNYKSC